MNRAPVTPVKTKPTFDLTAIGKVLTYFLLNLCIANTTLIFGRVKFGLALFHVPSKHWGHISTIDILAVAT
jgi:hypothetical protein